MITEERMKKAAEELADAMNRSLPQPEECSHSFSEEFEKKRNQIRKKAGRRKFIILQIAAGLLLVLIAGAASLFTVNEQARAALLHWLQRQQRIEEKPSKEPQAYPTLVPVPEFTPQEGQTELLLLIERGDIRGEAADRELIDTLNHYLQKKGYSFYLKVIWLNRSASRLEKTIDENELSVRRERTLQSELEAGVKPDFISVLTTDTENKKEYEQPNFAKAVQNGWLLPFSEYPDTAAARELMQVYPEEYKKFSSFRGECYGWCLSSKLVQQGIYFNQTELEKLGLSLPEETDLTNLDAFFETAAKQKKSSLLAIASVDSLCGLERLSCGLYLKHKEDGSVVFVNPLEDAETLRLLAALYRYKENGWIETWATLYKSPLIYKGNLVLDEFEDGVYRQGYGSDYVLYRELPAYQNEGNLSNFLAVTRMSEHKEEAVELLNLLFTDEEVIRIMRYGVEGFHYRMGEYGPQAFMGKGIKTITGGEEESSYEITEIFQPPGDASFANTKTELPEEAAWGRKSRASRTEKQIKNIIISPYVEEFTKEQEQLLTQIVKKERCFRILSISSKDYKTELELARKEMEEMGYNRLIKEMNEKYGFTYE